MIISAKIIKPRKERLCDSCYKVILRGTPTLLLYGMAEVGDPPYAVYLHPECDQSKEPKIIDAKKKAGV